MTDPLNVRDRLRRAPDLEGPGLQAVDAADRLLLDEAAPLLATAGPGEVVVLEDRYGALTVGAVLGHGASGVRTRADRLVSEHALARNAAALDVAHRPCEQDAELLRGARVVLLALPRSLAALDCLAGTVARHAAPDVQLLAGGRLKHMSRGMNDVLARHFTDVRASLGRQKSRVLHASGPLPQPDPGPARATSDGLEVCAYGGAFAAAGVDRGTRLLLRHLPHAVPDAQDAVDLGCGTGVLACSLRRVRPQLRVVASDESRAAVRSAAATARANGLDVEVVRDLGLSRQGAASADLVVLNPPFHTGGAVQEQVAHPLFADAARVLRPGGELWCVWNSHLGHRDVLRRLVGPTRQVDRDRSFTVTASVRSG